jgi:Ca-activated chloride channel family protein
MKNPSSNPRTRTIVVLVITLVVAALAVVGLRALTGPEGAPEANGPATSGAPDPSTCTVLNVMASSEKAALLQARAEAFNASDAARAGDTCYSVSVTSRASGAATNALSTASWDPALGVEPDVWSPASTSWVRLVSQARSSADLPSITPESSPSLANTPLVLAMPEPMARALGWPAEPLGWNDVLALSTNPEGWGSVAHPEWGQFKLGKTNPRFSTSGLNATIGAYFAATGLASDLSVADVDDPKTAEFVKSVESSVVHYGDTTLTFLENLRRADDEGRGLSYVSAVTLEEKSVWDYNTGNPSGNPATRGERPAPQTKLVAIYPEEGTLSSDNPFVVLDGAWVNAEKRAAADAFRDFLLAPESQDAFTSAAFRDASGAAGELATEDNGLIAAAPSLLSAPAPAVMAHALDAWDTQRKRAHTILVMDVSGSMGEAGKLEMAKSAASRALGQFADADEVGLWIFSTERDGGLPYRELLPVSALGAGGGSQREKLASTISNLTPEGGTGLYATARASVESVTASLAPGRINAVVLLTDGKNEFPADNDLNKLVGDLGSTEATGVRLFTIGYGADADMSALARISEATDAKAYNATDPATIDSVFTDVISNF